MCRCNAAIRTPFCGKPGCEWPDSAKVDGQPKIVKENREVATKFAQLIMEVGNKSGQVGMVAPMIASLTLQNVMLNLLIYSIDVGSPEGFEMIEQIYEAAKNDAKARWADDRFLRQRREQIKAQGRTKGDS